ncbi:MAG: hypothetical protein ACRDBX_04570 [Erysipelotrichaceae bacterium]
MLANFFNDPIVRMILICVGVGLLYAMLCIALRKKAKLIKTPKVLLAIPFVFGSFFILSIPFVKDTGFMDLVFAVNGMLLLGIGTCALVLFDTYFLWTMKTH